jgi:glutathione S-transferase
VQRLNAEDGLVWLDRELAARHFIAGEHFSIADITAVVAIDIGRVAKIAIRRDKSTWPDGTPKSHSSQR